MTDGSGHAAAWRLTDRGVAVATPLWLAALFAGIGLTQLVLGVPLIQRRVPPNPVYGFRVPSTLTNARLWYRVNRRLGWWLLSSGLADLLAAPLFYLAHREDAAHFIAWAGTFVVITVMLMVAGTVWHYLRVRGT